MYDKEYLKLQEKLYEAQAALNQFKYRWWCKGSIEKPKIRQKQITQEFIIQVPRTYTKVQYIPFVYLDYRTEIFYD